MKFGMIGAGTLAQAIAGHVVKAGHDVVFSNSRGPHTLGAVAGAFRPHASAGTVAEAGAADLVVLAVRWTQVRDAVRNLPAREGRIVIDATNQWARLTPAFVADRLETGGSELVASLIPGAHVIKAFDNMYGPYVAADPVTGPAIGSCSTRATTRTPRSSSAPSSRASDSHPSTSARSGWAA